jgi:hypothetical protein
LQAATSFEQPDIQVILDVLASVRSTFTSHAMSTTDPNRLSREELLIRSITTLLSIVKLQTAKPSEPPNKNDQLLLDRIALLFVRKPAGEIYSVVVVSHAFVENCDYDQRESESGSPKHKGNNTITLYLCPNATTEKTYDWYGWRSLLVSFGMMKVVTQPKLRMIDTILTLMLVNLHRRNYLCLRTFNLIG